MKLEELEEIFKNDATNWKGDNALQGLNIISKYFPEDVSVLCGADHDVIYSVDVDELCEHGLTKKDAEKLNELNWRIENDYLQCFV